MKEVTIQKTANFLNEIKEVIDKDLPLDIKLMQKKHHVSPAVFCSAKRLGYFRRNMDGSYRSNSAGITLWDASKILLRCKSSKITTITKTRKHDIENGIKNNIIPEFNSQIIDYDTIPPDIKDVASYCKKQNYSVDVIKWYNYYQSKGWKIGKNEMKDWRAAIRTWENSKNKYVPYVKDISRFEDKEIIAEVERRRLIPMSENKILSIEEHIEDLKKLGFTGIIEKKTTLEF